MCSVAQSVTCDCASLRIIFNLPLLEAEDSSQTLLIPRSVLVVSSLRCHIYSFFIQFTSNRLLLYNSHHIIRAVWVPFLLILYYFVLLLCIYEFVLCHRLRFRPICMYKFVKLHSTRSHIRIRRKYPQHTTNLCIQISPTMYTTKSHVRIRTKYQGHKIW